MRGINPKNACFANSEITSYLRQIKIFRSTILYFDLSKIKMAYFLSNGKPYSKMVKQAQCGDKHQSTLDHKLYECTLWSLLDVMSKLSLYGQSSYRTHCMSLNKWNVMKIITLVCTKVNNKYTTKIAIIKACTLCKVNESSVWEFKILK